MSGEITGLTNVQKTCLLTLYGKAVDAGADDPILGDTFAADAVRQLDFDFASLKPPKGGEISLPVRAKHLDQWTTDFLAAHPRCTVLHLGCGLDTRVQRVDPPAGVAWYDVDLPEIIELRERLYPARENYRMIGASVTDPSWLSGIDTDTPVLVVAEGLVMHVPTADVLELFRRVVRAFGSGEFAFDVYGAPIARVIAWGSRSGTVPVRLHWGLPKALRRELPEVRLADSVPFLLLPELVARLSTNALARGFFRVVRAGFMRDSLLHQRYRFG